MFLEYMISGSCSMEFSCKAICKQLTDAFFQDFFPFNLPDFYMLAWKITTISGEIFHTCFLSNCLLRLRYVPENQYSGCPIPILLQQFEEKKTDKIYSLRVLMGRNQFKMLSAVFCFYIRTLLFSFQPFAYDEQLHIFLSYGSISSTLQWALFINFRKKESNIFHTMSVISVFACYSFKGVPVQSIWILVSNTVLVPASKVQVLKHCDPLTQRIQSTKVFIQDSNSQKSKTTSVPFYKQ